MDTSVATSGTAPSKPSIRATAVVVLVGGAATASTRARPSSGSRPARDTPAAAMSGAATITMKGSAIVTAGRRIVSARARASTRRRVPRTKKKTVAAMAGQAKSAAAGQARPRTMPKARTVGPRRFS
jgi:hypothetical protein